MATITQNTTAQQSQYLSDGKNNRAETPGTGNTAGGTGSVVGADGSTAVKTALGAAPNITVIPQPGQGFPTGKSSVNSTGTYPKLVDPTIQRTSDNNAGGTVSGYSVTSDPNAGAKNTLQNFIACTPAKAGSGNAPTMPATSLPSAGWSQSPNTE